MAERPKAHDWKSQTIYISYFLNLKIHNILRFSILEKIVPIPYPMMKFVLNCSFKGQFFYYFRKTIDKFYQVGYDISKWRELPMQTIANP